MRRAIRVRGAVQGVGFRPAVYRMARAARLAGFVRNDPGGVWIEVEGDGDALERFTDALVRDAPPLARITCVEVTDLAPRGDSDFFVASSETGEAVGAPTRAAARIPADAATCDACLRELFDPRDRRYRYPFINCTDCGPRFTIVRDVPYDRARTTMGAFVMCARCRAEYEDPSDRRFHAEPNACPECGPRVALIAGGRRVAEGDAAIVAAIARLAAGAIVAIKGLGGYQLAVDAANEGAVHRLRERKRRPHKPFALMARDLRAIEDIADVDEVAREALRSPSRPIVLLPARAQAIAHSSPQPNAPSLAHSLAQPVASSLVHSSSTPSIAPSVAPSLREIGVMLPTTPLHHLLFCGGPPRLVMTSGNLAEEPIARDDDEAMASLGAVADAFLVHDREIHARADDSVVRVVAGGPQPVRRARGFVPDAIALEAGGPSVLAVGPQLKSTVCITRGDEAHLSQHIGDLDEPKALAFFEETIEKLARLLGVEPVAVAHDLHPDYASTRWAMRWAIRSATRSEIRSEIRSSLRRIPVQHHHAHVASCMAEHGRTAPVLGVAFDGTGCGPMGDLWGGEVLLADLAGFRRLGHLRPLALPGGEAAIREPWRLAVAALHDAGEDDALLPLPIDAARRRHVVRMIERGVACPPATGAGRWFDAVAALLGLRDAISYEGQAAIELEALAWLELSKPEPPCQRGPSAWRSYAFEIDAPPDAPFVVDLRPVVRAIVADLRHGHPASRIAARFHATLAAVILDACQRARRDHGTATVALSGGCFQNRWLTERAAALLQADGFEVLVHRRVPPNDGGVALGQAAIAAHRLRLELEAHDGPPRQGRVAEGREA